MMRCKSAERLLPEYIEGTLSQKQVDGLEFHLDNCLHCQSELEALEQTIRLASNLPVEYPSPEMWADFWPQLRMKIEQQPLPKTSHLPFWVWQHAGKLATALFLMVFLVGMWGVSSSRLFRAPKKNQTISLEQVICQNLMREIPMRQLREQLSRELQSMEIIGFAGSDEGRIVNELHGQEPATSGDQLHHLFQVIATEVDHNYFDDEELTDLISSASDGAVFVSMDSDFR